MKEPSIWWGSTSSEPRRVAYLNGLCSRQQLEHLQAPSLENMLALQAIWGSLLAFQPMSSSVGRDAPSPCSRSRWGDRMPSKSPLESPFLSCAKVTNITIRTRARIGAVRWRVPTENLQSVDPSAWSDDNSSSRSDHYRTWSNDDRSRGYIDRSSDAARLVHTEDAVDDGARFRRRQSNEASN